MSRCHAKGKGDYGTDHEGRDDNNRVIVFVYFHVNLSVILIVYFAILRSFL